jgi:putative transposase
VEIWVWCLMPNHVHPILVPFEADGLRRALAPVHRRYAGVIHARRKWTGHFWPGRFGCVAMDEEHLAAALRYVSLNPVRASTVRATGAGPACERISAAATTASRRARRSESAIRISRIFCPKRPMRK